MERKRREEGREGGWVDGWMKRRVIK